MIVAGAEGFEKSEYRKYNIKSAELTPGDDYGMMREVLTRRFSRLVKESEADEAKANGPISCRSMAALGQLRGRRQSVLEDLGVEDVMLVGISKGPDRDAGREHFYMKDREPFRLDTESPVLYYLQRLRDEAHRFAIGIGAENGRKAIGANPLDEHCRRRRPRKRALLQHFGSARAVAGASLADLEAVGWRQQRAGEESIRFLPRPSG